MNATFCFSNAIPRRIARTPRTRVAILEAFISVASSTLPFPITLAYRSWLIADAPESVRPDTTARIVANATAEIKPRNKSPPTARDRWIATILSPPTIAFLSPTKTCVAFVSLTIVWNPLTTVATPFWKYVGSRASSVIAPKPMINVKI